MKAALKWAAFFYLRKGKTMNDESSPTKWTKGMPSPNPKGRPKQPKNTAEVRALARGHTTGALEALREYKSEWDDELRPFKRTPLHNWASHAADAFRYLAMAQREPMNVENEKPDPIKEMLKPRTWNSAWDEYVNERIEDGEEIENWGFNLNG